MKLNDPTIPISAIRRIEVNPGDAVLLQFPRETYRDDQLRKALAYQTKLMAEALGVQIFLMFDDVTVTVIGPAAAHDLAEQVTPFERAIGEIPP